MGRVLLWLLVAALLVSLLSAAVKLLVVVMALLAAGAALVWLFSARPALFCALVLVVLAYVGLRAGPWVWAVLGVWALLELGSLSTGWFRKSPSTETTEAASAAHGRPEALGSRGGA
jgi:hypothetical protein